MVGFDKDVYIELVLTKYTLAPILLEKSLNHEWIVVNSTSSEFLGRVTTQITDPFTVRDFGSGIYLIHKEVSIMFLLAALAFLPKLILGFSIAHLIWADQRISSLLLKFFLGIPLGHGNRILSSFLFEMGRA